MKYAVKKLSFSLPCTAILIIAMFFASSYFKVLETVQSVESIMPTVVLDAGHGGFDGGASVNNILEKDINLKIALNLADILKINGFNVILTRKDDNAINTMGNSISQKKVSDMKNRLKIAESYPDGIFVSIHLNKFTTSAPFGAQVFYGTKNEQSKNLAECIQQSIKSMLQKNNKRTVKSGTKDTYLLYKTTIPAVIVECGFLSNPTDFKLLQEEEYQRKMAFAIFCGIAFDYYER